MSWRYPACFSLNKRPTKLNTISLNVGVLKVMAITSTIIEVVSTGQEFTVPGDRTPEQLVATYGADITGLSSMSSEVVVQGTVKRVIFRPRSGTKG